VLLPPKDANCGPSHNDLNLNPGFNTPNQAMRRPDTCINYKHVCVRKDQVHKVDVVKGMRTRAGLASMKRKIG
jgi:hypothetical protein